MTVRLTTSTLVFVAATLAAVSPILAAPARPTTTAVEKVVTAKHAQVQPSAARLSTGSVLLSFERLFTAHRRRVYVQRRRAGKGWSWARALPLIKGDYTQRAASLVVQKKDRVLLYVQVGDLRRRRSAVRLYTGTGDAFRWRDAGRLQLTLPQAKGRLVFTEPHAASDRQGGVLLAVTRRFARAADGCHWSRSADGQRFAALRRLNAGQRCRIIATAPGKYILTYQSRAKHRLPWRSYFRRSSDSGKTWSKPQTVSALWHTSDVHTLAEPGGVRFLFVVSKGKGSAIQSALWKSGRRTEVRLTRPGRRRDINPFGLRTPQGSFLFFAREVRPLDFDVLGLPVGPQKPKRPAPRRR